jgi:hypothetical protein
LTQRVEAMREPPTQVTDPFATLNDSQRCAVEHGTDPLLVIAGAGSGKTMTLASRVARLVLSGADPQRNMLVTFSRRAAQEMERRVGRGLNQALQFASTQRPPSLPWSGTFHALGARLLREYAGPLDPDAQSECGTLYPFKGDPRIAAGGPRSGDVLKCQLKAVTPSDYAVPFAPAEWSRLRTIFPNGVCDWSKPGVQQPPLRATRLAFPSPGHAVRLDRGFDDDDRFDDHNRR